MTTALLRNVNIDLIFPKFFYYKDFRHAVSPKTHAVMQFSETKFFYISTGNKSRG